MTIQIQTKATGHARLLRRNHHHTKEICLQCHSYSKNCSADCSGEFKLQVSNAFRPPPKNREKAWRELMVIYLEQKRKQQAPDSKDLMGFTSTMFRIRRKSKTGLPRKFKEKDTRSKAFKM